MIQLQFTPTDSRKVLPIMAINLVQKLKHIFLFSPLFFFIASCNSGNGQTTSNLVAGNTRFENATEFYETDNNLKKENNRQFLLGAIKLCQNEDYEAVIGNKPKDLTEIQSHQYCYTYYLNSPWGAVNPYETYMNRIMNNENLSIYANKPFKLKEYRESSWYLNTVEEIKEDAEAMNVNALKWYSLGSVLVEEYDFNSEELVLSIPSRRLLGHNGASVRTLTFDKKQRIPFAEKKAKELFELYEELSKSSRGKSFNSVITYRLSAPDNTQSNNLIITPIRMEIFIPDGWNEKIHEIIF